MEKKLNITDVLDLDVMQRIQDAFAEATGYAAIIVDRDGKPVVEYSNFCDYCLEIRKTTECQVCYESDANGGCNAAETLEPAIYMCHAGLVDFAVPIIVQGQYIGAILAGQTRIEPEMMEKFSKNPNFKVDLSEDAIFNSDPTLRAKYNDTLVSTYKQVKAASQLLFTLANHMAEMQMLNHMQSKLHEKEIELSEETRLRSEVEAALKEADLKALQAQINPHFLFNVLNTIGRLAMIENATRTQEMVYQFSDLMRYNLKRGNTEVTSIREEIEYVRNYLSIQKTRLGDRLTFEIDIAPETEEVLCPVMTIQPFVENAINHVIEPKLSGGSIRIQTKSAGKVVHIIINDDGQGIPEDVAERVLNGSYTSDKPSTGIGINNANKRLKYYFGPEFGLQIGHSEEGGTRILIRVPNNILE